MKLELKREVLKKLLLIIKKTLSDEQIDNVLSLEESKNLIDCIDYLIYKYGSIDDLYSSLDYVKLINIFKKTRIREFPSLDFYINIPVELSSKFKLKVYRLFYDSHLFEDDETLVKMIAVMGLFEDDNEVQSRINEVIRIFFHQTIYCEREELLDNSNIIKKKVALYILDKNIWEFISEELKPYFFEFVTPSYYSFIKNMKGNFGRKINDFLTPFNPEGELKSSIKLNKAYEEYLEDKDYDYHPFIKDVDEYVGVNTKLSLDKIKDSLRLFEEYELTYGPSDIKSMFKKCVPVFDKEFYNYFISHQTDIINSRNSFSKLPFIQEKFKELVCYYQLRGNNNPDFITLVELLRTVPYDILFGDEDFAYEARNAGVLNNMYKYYESLLRKVRTRYIRALPNHNNRYDIIGKDGNNYVVEARILDGTDYLNMLIGESKYTDCCQKADDLGKACLEHASTSKCGGILLISIVTNDGVFPISQSWVWINEQELVVDNVEQTVLLKMATDKQREIYEDLIAEAIKKFGNEIIINSNVELNKYIKLQIENASISNIFRLKEILLRQSIKVVTLGSGYSDIITNNYFNIKAKRDLMLPKDYDQNGYTDAKIRYVVAGSEEAITVEPDFKYVEEAIYRIPRKVYDSKLTDVSTSIIKRIGDIDNISIDNLEQFYTNYDLEFTDKVVYGEDWYILYRESSEGVEILKYNAGFPSLEDEIYIQAEELKENINKLNILKKINKVKER